jgi:hypothetical protein
VGIQTERLLHEHLVVFAATIFAHKYTPFGSGRRNATEFVTQIMFVGHVTPITEIHVLALCTAPPNSLNVWSFAFLACDMSVLNTCGSHSFFFSQYEKKNPKQTNSMVDKYLQGHYPGYSFGRQILFRMSYSNNSSNVTFSRILVDAFPVRTSNNTHSQHHRRG